MLHTLFYSKFSMPCWYSCTNLLSFWLSTSHLLFYICNDWQSFFLLVTMLSFFKQTSAGWRNDRDRVNTSRDDENFPIELRGHHNERAEVRDVSGIKKMELFQQEAFEIPAFSRVHINLLFPKCSIFSLWFSSRPIWTLQIFKSSRN